MVPVPILDQNDKVQSYMLLQPRKPYIALNSETYIALRQQELRTCRRIGYKFYCKERFVIKQKTSYSCESTIYFIIIDGTSPIDLNSTENTLLNRQAFAGQHGCFLRSEGNVYPIIFFAKCLSI